MKNKYVLAIYLIVGHSSYICAQPVTGVQPIINKQIIEEVIHTFTIKKMAQEVLVIGQPVLNLPAKTPEKTVQDWLLDMNQSSYKEVMLHWDVAAREKSRLLDLQQKKSNAQWEREWQSLMNNSSVTITNRIAYGAYIIFTLDFKDINKTINMKETVALNQIDGAWFLTNDLVENVVFNKWDSEEKRIQRLANPLFKKLQSK